MEDVNSIAIRLESYLLHLSEINGRWSHWLRGNELAVFNRDVQQLSELELQAADLLGELSGVLDQRRTLLADAEQAGMPAPDLRGLARQLPARKRQLLRGGLAKAGQQLANLRRLHVATWVLMSQRLQLYRDSMALMATGTAQQVVYLPNSSHDNGGGQLLDANL